MALPQVLTIAVGFYRQTTAVSYRQRNDRYSLTPFFLSVDEEKFSSQIGYYRALF